MDMRILKPFIDGTTYTLGIHLRVAISSGKPFIKGAPHETLRIDIAGVVSVYTKEFKGNIFLCFPEQTFLKAMEQILGEKYPSITNEIADGAGEMMNIIFGYAKTKLNEQGHHLEMVFPSVINAENLKIGQKTATTVIILPFNCSLGEFHLEVAFE